MDPFILDTDASDCAIGAELLQVQGGIERVIAFGSLSLATEQRRYCTTRKELLAVVRFTRQYRHDLLGRRFTVRTDHNSLRWLVSFKEPQGQLARWMEELSLYDMVIEHRPGKNHGNADALSRKPGAASECNHYKLGLELQELPCQGCNYCQKAHRNWSEFASEVDDVVPLPQQASQEAQVLEEETVLAACSIEADVSTAEEEHRSRETPAYEYGSTVEGPIDKPAVHRHVDILWERNRVDMYGPEEQKLYIVTNFANQEVDIGVEQRKDSDLDIIIAWLESGTVPAEGTLFSSSPAAKYYWLNKELYTLEGAILKRSSEGRYLLVVPESLQQRVMQAHHDLPSSGHQGMDRTRSRIKDKYYWFGMSQMINGYVSTCSVCNHRKKTNRRAKFPMTSFQAGYPMERVHLDFMGPLPRTTNGNVYVLMMVDQFTKWVECIALPSQTAEVTAHAAVSEFFSRFGYPFQIHSDQGRNFESRLFAAVCDLLDIHKSRTTPYRPSANGQVERFNRTLMDAVRCL